MKNKLNADIKLTMTVIRNDGTKELIETNFKKSLKDKILKLKGGNVPCTMLNL